MKRIMIMLLSGLMIVTMLSGCTSKKEIEEKTATPEELIGNYYDTVAGRAMMKIEAHKITIDWSSSAAEKAHYEFDTEYSKETKQIKYENGKLVNQVFASDGSKSETEVYTDGSGYFAEEGYNLVWHDNKENQDVLFIKEGGEGNFVPNPWTYTDNLEEALKVSGLEFDPPIPESLPEGYKFTGYMAMEGTIRAMYENGVSEMIVSKSNLLSGVELSGDYHEYSKHWEDSHKGVHIDMYGDGETINMAFFSNTVENFAITVLNQNIEIEEGYGITYDELCSLIMGMQ